MQNNMSNFPQNLARSRLVQIVIIVCVCTSSLFPLLASADASVDYLVVGGGGGGGSNRGGGGGAGGFVTGSMSLAPGAYTVTIGTSGPGAPSSGAATDGGQSVFGSITASGGGHGSGSNVPGCGTGGSGGGNNDSGTGCAGTTGQGNAGGNGFGSGSRGGGGGGGASAVGANGTTSNGGNGGAGTSSSISGASVTYAGGGGGAVLTSGTNGTGGAGGGGNGQNTTTGSAATANTGGGGGAGGSDSVTIWGGGAGGSGIVIVRYLTTSPITATGGTITSSGGYTIHTFTSSGTFTVSAKITFSGNVKFAGNLAIVGSLTKGSGTFEIDHPLDPANKILFHSFVESPDVMNIYNGIATLDESGEAVIQLPAYYDALNTDSRYQFSPVGRAMPNLYIKTEEKKNQFTISGGVSGGKVSWQVTGIRHDAYILAHPIIVEVNKGPNAMMDKGTCLFAPLCQ